MKNRFEKFQIYENIFGFLFDLNKLISLDHDNLEKYYVNLESFLKHDNFMILMVLIFFYFLFFFRIKSRIRYFTKRKKRKWLNYFLNVSIAWLYLLQLRILKEVFQSKIIKILLVINYVTKKIKCVSHIIHL